VLKFLVVFLGELYYPRIISFLFSKTFKYGSKGFSDFIVDISSSGSLSFSNLISSILVCFSNFG